MGANVAGNTVAVAPLHLPHGAVITQFRVVVLDNDAAQNASLTLHRNNQTTGAVENLQTLLTTGASAAAQTLTGSALTHTVDNETYAYSIKSEWDSTASGFRIYSARITYTVDKPLP
jgi:hypothetical protein